MNTTEIRINCAFCPLLSLAIKLVERKQLAYRCPNINEETDLQINLCTRGIPSHPFCCVNTLMLCMAECSDKKKKEEGIDHVVNRPICSGIQSQ